MCSNVKPVPESFIGVTMSREKLLPAIKVLKAIMSGKSIIGIECTEELRASCQASLLLLEDSQPVKDEIYIMEFDGASKGNPGPAGLGVVLYDPSGTIVEKLGKALPATTNNVAEYQALIAGLQLAKKIGILRLYIRTDSELVARQLCGEYKIRKPELIQLAMDVKALLAGFESYTIKHIPREQNRLADKLASTAIKNQANKER